MMQRSLFRTVKVAFASLIAGGLALAAVPAAAHAEQFLLFDVMFTYTKENADNSTPSKSHYYVRNNMLNAARPTNWLSPIDYRNGTVHVRAEVIDKPAGGANTRWTLCYIPNSGGYGCANTAAYTEKGVHEIDTGMTTWWQNEMINWANGIKQMDLVMKDATGKFAHTLPAEQYFPTTIRITMVQVSQGSTYDASKVPNLPPSTMVPDGGVKPDGGATADASTSADSGGGSGGTSGGGSGGSDGSGGAAGTAGSGGSSGAAGSSGGSGSGGSAPVTGSGGASGGSTTGTGGSTSGPGAVTAGGCAVAGGQLTDVAGAFGLLGLVAVLARRRRR